MKNVCCVFLLMALIAMVIACGCSNGQRAVSVNNGNNGAFIPNQNAGEAGQGERVFSSESDCEAGGFECVKEMKEGGITGNFIREGHALEGETFALIDDEQINILDDVCASGLTAVAYTVAIEGDCAYTACPCYVCVKCPNGECGPGENECNCPQDCD